MTKVKEEKKSEFQLFIENNKDGRVNITPEISYTIRDVIKRDKRLKNSIFKKPYAKDGSKKKFVQIIAIIARTLDQNTDFDTRHFNMTANNVETIPLVGLLKAGLKQYLNYSNYAQYLNDTGTEFVDEGHVILKKCEDGFPKSVNLLNIIRPAHIEDMSAGIAEENHLSWQDILAYKDEWQNWEEVEKYKDRLEKAGEALQFIVYEWWRWKEFEGKLTIVCEKYLEATGTDAENPNATEQGSSHYIKVDEFETPWTLEVRSKARLKKLRKAGILGPNETKVPIMPYVEAPLFRVPGRWKGMGVYELLATIQELYNETWYDKRRYDKVRRKGIIVYKESPDKEEQTLTQEWLNRIDTGGLFTIRNDEEAHEINMGNLAVDFISSLDKIFELARLLSGVTSQRAGENQPASQSATGILRDEKVADTTFGYVRERKGILYKRLFEYFELKSLIDDMVEEDYIALMGDRKELEKIEEPYIENLVNRKIQEAADTGKFVPQSSKLPDEERNKIIKAVKLVRSQGTRFAQFKKEFLKNIDLILEFYLTDESLDFNRKIKELQETINTLVQLPNSNISVDALIKKKLEYLDTRFTDYEKTPEELERDAAAQEANKVQNTGVPQTTEAQQVAQNS